MGGTSADLRLLFELCVAFPDLIQEAAATDKNNLCVGSKKATLGVGCDKWRKCML